MASQGYGLRILVTETQNNKIYTKCCCLLVPQGRLELLMIPWPISSSCEDLDVSRPPAGFIAVSRRIRVGNKPGEGAELKPEAPGPEAFHKARRHSSTSRTELTIRNGIMKRHNEHNANILWTEKRLLLPVGRVQGASSICW